MKADIEVTKGFGVIQAQAETERGSNFLDAYTALELVAVDSGRLILPDSGEFALMHRAREAGLVVEYAS